MSRKAIREKDPTITAAVDAVLDRTADWKRGRLITWTDILSWTGYDRDHPQWGGFVRQLKRQFRRLRGIELFHFGRDDGYRLPSLDDQIGLIPYLRSKRAGRQAAMSLRAMDAVPTGDLSDRQRLRLFRSREDAKATRKAARKARKNYSVTVDRPPQRPKPAHMGGK